MSTFFIIVGALLVGSVAWYELKSSRPTTSSDVKEPSPTDSTSENMSVSGVTELQPTESDGTMINPGDQSSWPSGDKAWDVAHAIAKAEGYNVSGSVPQRLHNPGDISDGSAKFGSQSHSGSNVTTFPDDETGWQWLHDKIQNIADGNSKVYDADWTWLQIAQTWAADWKPWVQTVTNELGVNESDRFTEYFS